MSFRQLKSDNGIRSRDGFTMIELMVVVAIIIMASGIMGPTIADFMKNRQLEGVRGQFGNIFNMARQNLSGIYLRYVFGVSPKQAGAIQMALGTPNSGESVCCGRV